jgi:hypothetical protein
VRAIYNENNRGDYDVVYHDKTKGTWYSDDFGPAKRRD